uniref:SWIM-type domain-containing protein n=1 Tax=Cajanus cajan TaxID=3821 RepID=A0A151UCG0_CAJCA|nr:hypothetical protein KK1_021201 [Cajanus cajan]
MNQVRVERRLAESGACLRCSCSQETILHALRDCPHSREVLMSVGSNLEWSSLVMDCYHWLKGIILNKDAIKISITLWWVWRFRNNMIFNDERWMISEVCQNVVLSTVENSLYNVKRRLWEEKALWRPLEHPWVKLNTDGS